MPTPILREHKGKQKECWLAWELGDLTSYLRFVTQKPNLFGPLLPHLENKVIYSFIHCFNKHFLHIFVYQASCWKYNGKSTDTVYVLMEFPVDWGVKERKKR